MLALSLFMRNAERPTSFAAPNTEIFNCFLTYLPGWCFKYFIRICFPSYKVSIDLHGPGLYCLIIRWSNQRMGNGEQVNQYCSNPHEQDSRAHNYNCYIILVF